MKFCPTCNIEKENKEFGSNTRSCKKCNIKNCSVCGNVFCPTGKKTHCSNRCNILGNIKKTEEDCWEWQKYKDKRGYGRIRDTDSKKLILVHRLSYKIFKEEIPSDKFSCHYCDNPCCCNPDHLFIGDHKSNGLDAFKKGRLFEIKKVRFIGGSAKITEKEVKEIRKLCSEGIRDCEIARKYSMSQTNIRNIRLKRLWKNVEEGN